MGVGQEHVQGLGHELGLGLAVSVDEVEVFIGCDAFFLKLAQELQAWQALCGPPELSHRSCEVEHHDHLGVGCFRRCGRCDPICGERVGQGLELRGESVGLAGAAGTLRPGDHARLAGDRSAVWRCERE